MKMRSGAASRASDGSQNIVRCYGVTDFRVDGSQMGVPRSQPSGMLHQDSIAVPAFIPRRNNSTGQCRHDRHSCRSRQIYSLVESWLTV